MRRTLACSLLFLLLVGTAAAQQTAEGLRQARQLYGAHRYEEARDALAALLQERPDDTEANLLMGRTLLVLGDYAAAEDALELAASGPGRVPFMVFHTRGMVSLRQRHWQRAETHFDAALEQVPLYAGSLIARAQARAFQGHVEEALEDLRAVERSPRPQPAARLLAGELHLARGDVEAAFDAFGPLAQAGERTFAAENAGMYVATMAPAEEDTEDNILRGMSNVLQRAAPYFWLAVVRRSQGDPAGARRLLRTALAVDDLHAPSWVALQAMEDAPASLEALVGPPLPGIDHRMSQLQAAVERRELDAAETAARELLEKRPAFVPAQILLVEIARARRRPLAVLQALEALASTVPELPDAHAERAVIARDIGALELAETEARRAVELLSGDGSLRFLLCTVLAAAGESAEAATQCETALELGYDVAPLHVVLGNVYQELQRLPDAVDQLERAVEMDPAMAEGVASFALSAMTAADNDRLVALLETALEGNPESPNVLYALGSLHQRTGDPERAAELFERLLTVAPRRSEIHYNLSLAYRRLGRVEEAEEQQRLFEELKAEEDREFEAANATYRRRAEAVQALADGDAERAVELLRQVTGAVGSEPRDHTLLGSALLAAGQPQAAAEAYRHTLERAPYDREALCGAAAAAERLGDTAEAAELRRRVEALGQTCPAPDTE